MLVNEKVCNLKLIILDIDGVLTDGHVIIDAKGNEQKQIFFRDLDAVGIGHRLGLEFMIATGEDNELVDVIARRFCISAIIRGVKDKLAELMNVCSQRRLKPETVCYVGDSDRDAAAISWAGLGVAPADASAAAKAAADYVAFNKGGDGVLAEIIDLIAKNGEEKRIDQ
jgi:3-deoxy-D-manno-octulosonate 8-phosphate phosphatase (KDO 8-P phosphatase)